MDWKTVRERLPAGGDMRLLSLAAVCCFGIWSFLELADDAPEGDYLHFEKQLLESLREAKAPKDPLGPQWLEDAAYGLTALGGLPVLILITVLVCGYLLLQKRFRTALYVIVATVAGGCLTFYLKSFFARERPSVVPPLAEVSTHSFPSGHAMTSSIVYMTLGTLLAQAATRQNEKLYFICVALFLSFLIGLTRVYLGVHYPTDVMAGWAAGTSWALLCWAVVYGLKRLRSARDSATSKSQ